MKIKLDLKTEEEIKNAYVIFNQIINLVEMPVWTTNNVDLDDMDHYFYNRINLYDPKKVISYSEHVKKLTK